MANSKVSHLPITVGVVGCGGIAQVLHLPLLKKIQDVDVTAVCDTDTAKAAVVANKYGIKNVYGDIEKMLKKQLLDVVFILTPNNMHLPMTLFALDQGMHVFVEKPAARTVQEVSRMHEKAKAVGREVMVGMQNRFRPDIMALEKFISGKELGKISRIKMEWLQARDDSIKQSWQFNKNVAGGGVLMDLGVQALDLIWLLSEKNVVSKVHASTFKFDENLDVEDSCLACISFENGIRATMEVSWDYPILKDRFQIEIVGENGTGTLNPLQLQKLWHGQIMNMSPDLKESRVQHFRKGYANEIDHFFDYLKGDVKTLNSNIEEAEYILKIIGDIYDSNGNS